MPSRPYTPNSIRSMLPSGVQTALNYALPEDDPLMGMASPVMEVEGIGSKLAPLAKSGLDRGKELIKQLMNRAPVGSSTAPRVIPQAARAGSVAFGEGIGNKALPQLGTLERMIYDTAHAPMPTKRPVQIANIWEAGHQPKAGGVLNEVLERAATKNGMGQEMTSGESDLLKQFMSYNKQR